MEARSALLGPRRRPRWTRPLAAVGDERLAQLVGGGSEEAFAALYERYHQPLYRYSRSMLASDLDAQDALQSAFARAFVALSQGRRNAPLRPWLYRIVHNEAVSVMRRGRPEVELAESHLVPAPSAAEVAGERERLALLVRDLGQLTERQRGALVMRELAGLSHAEIAVALGLDTGGAKQTIFEARRSLHEFGEGRAMPCDDVCRAISDGGGRSLRARRVRAHLRGCASCREFASAIPNRSRDLRAVAPPLTGVAATGILRRALSSGTGHGGGGVGVAGTAAKTVALSALSKTMIGAAVLATAAVGVTSVLPGPVRSVGTGTALTSDPLAPAPASGGSRALISSGAPATALTHRVAAGAFSRIHGRSTAASARHEARIGSSHRRHGPLMTSVHHRRGAAGAAASRRGTSGKRGMTHNRATAGGGSTRGASSATPPRAVAVQTPSRASTVSPSSTTVSPTTTTKATGLSQTAGSGAQRLGTEAGGALK